MDRKNYAVFKIEDNGYKPFLDVHGRMELFTEEEVLKKADFYKNTFNEDLVFVKMRT